MLRSVGSRRWRASQRESACLERLVDGQQGDHGVLELELELASSDNRRRMLE